MVYANSGQLICFECGDEGHLAPLMRFRIRGARRHAIHLIPAPLTLGCSVPLRFLSLRLGLWPQLWRRNNGEFALILIYLEHAGQLEYVGLYGT